MTTAKINVIALQTVSHGNLDMKQGKTYTMSAGEAKELAKVGFVSLDSKDESEGILGELPLQKKQPGDVVVDDPDELLGDSKMAPVMSNKMAPASTNKAPKK